MATLDYVEIPTAAMRLQARKASGNSGDLRPATKILTSLPHPEKTPRGPPSTPVHAQSPTKSSFNFQQVLLSSTFQIPANAPAAPRATKGAPMLLSTRDPLSLPITTANFRRFVARVGPVFWLQDRLEEIVVWRKGWKYSTVWICAYAFLCFYPRMFFLLPLVIILGVLLATHPLDTSGKPQPTKLPPPPPGQADQWSLDWLSNVQAIQNLMGAVSDAHDFVYPVVPHLSHTSPYTPVILTLVVLLLIVSSPLTSLIPLRTTFLILGIAPFFLTHPFSRYTLVPFAIDLAAQRLVTTRVWVAQFLDNDRLTDRHWRSELRTVELWENERWTPGPDENAADGGWGKANLRPGERRAWTRGRDGWSGVADDGTGDVSNLTFSLSSGWLFVETEEWRPDLEGSWIGRDCADESGWVYTDDVWMNPSSAPREQSSGLTRRRRWTRRIYYDPSAVST